MDHSKLENADSFEREAEAAHEASSCCGGVAEKTAAAAESSCCHAAAEKTADVGASSCCHAAAAQAHSDEASSCCPPAERTDWLLWGSGTLVAIGYLIHLAIPDGILPGAAQHFAHGVFEFMNTMWWGLVLGIIFVGILNKVPRELVMGVLGRDGGVSGILRATGAGLAFDLCSHGILLIGLKLYERGATIGQTVAFLVASPWNSLSLTVILIALIGLKWTVVFIALSAVVAVAAGVLFDALVARGVLPGNPHRDEMPPRIPFSEVARETWRGINWRAGMVQEILIEGLKDSRMILRWILFGVVLAAAIRVLLNPDAFADWFGPTLFGLAATLLATTIIEVCSEGSSPIAADLLNRAAAPGNGFTFLMAGVATDYTEIMGLKERTRSWKIALFLPLITVPQVLVIGYLLNVFG